MELTLAVLLVVAVLVFVVGVTKKDLPEPEFVSPVRHLEEKKERIYEGLRDLQFEYRVGKLSDADYQRTKTDLQKELAGVLAAIDKASTATPPKKEKARGAALACPHCGTSLDKPMKFCGECGKAIVGGAA